MEIGIVAQRGNGAARDLADELRGALRSQDVDVLVDETTGDDLGIEGVPVERMADCPMVVSIGGDGTFLYVARGVGSTPILGVNLGEVGFLNAVPPEDATERVIAEVERIREAGEPQYRDVRRLSATADGHAIPPALNEIVVQGPQRGRGNGLDVAVRVDGSTYVETHADGVLVATPTGSTAYSLSEGGPLVHPGVDALVLSGMATTTPMRSVLVPPDATVEIEANGAAHAVVASDGSERETVETPATIAVAATDEPGRIAGPRSDFFRALSKLE